MSDLRTQFPQKLNVWANWCERGIIGYSLSMIQTRRHWKCLMGVHKIFDSNKMAQDHTLQ